LTTAVRTSLNGHNLHKVKKTFHFHMIYAPILSTVNPKSILVKMKYLQNN
jgi:hypothetical protein